MLILEVYYRTHIMSKILQLPTVNYLEECIVKKYLPFSRAKVSLSRIVIQ